MSNLARCKGEIKKAVSLEMQLGGAECFSSTYRAPGSIPALQKLDVVVHICNTST